MQTTFRINVTDINENFLKVLRALLKKNKKAEITVQSVSESSATERDASRLYWEEIASRIKNAELGKNLVSFSEDEFENFSNELLARSKR
ncbi:MAG TPA: hypothetical protein VI757_14915 [Bacteroidia bacterium]|nr:hypothetical protein [Bacteroidia bacterium]